MPSQTGSTLLVLPSISLKPNCYSSLGTPSITLSTNSGPITQVDSLSYLVTKYLKWNRHIPTCTPVLRQNLNCPHFPPCTNLPLLDYCSSVWKPSWYKSAGIGSEVRSETLFQTLVRPIPSSAFSELKTVSAKVTLCRRIIRGESILRITLNLKPNPRHYQPLLIPFAKTLSYQSSFFVNAVPLDPTTALLRK